MAVILLAGNLLRVIDIPLVNDRLQGSDLPAMVLPDTFHRTTRLSFVDGSIRMKTVYIISRLTQGIAKIDTIYPGWYAGRALHIHLKIFVGGKVYDNGTFSEAVNAYTGQIFFNVYPITFLM
jgi:hypothetical protein